MEVILVATVFLLLLAIEVPIAWSLAASGALGILLLRGADASLGALTAVPYNATSNFLLTIIPMYILLGMFAREAGIAEDIYALLNRMAKKVPGGLGVATVAACATFGAISGSSSADVATLGKTTVREMRRYGYKPSFAAAIVASAGTLAILIPPSIILVIYAALSAESVGKLLLAGIVPGVLSAVVISLFIMARVRFSPKLVSHGVGQFGGPKIDTGWDDLDAGDVRRQGILGLVKLAIIFMIVVGGIYTGLLTATESAAIGALAGLVILVSSKWKNKRELGKSLFRAMKAAAAITSVVFAIYIGASIFTYFFVSARVPSNLAESTLGLDVEPWLIVVFVLGAAILLGMVLDGLSILLIIVPLTYPIVTELGFDGIWFGILLVKAIEIGLITPPVGINAFMVGSVTPGVRLESIFASLVPFVILDIALMALLFTVPDIILWLPNVAGAQ
jgi:tripartite ATP-independent transporter DctM subunit